MRYWLLKTEPDAFSIEDLARQPDQTTYWEGVRNYQARNYLRDEMRVGDPVLIYHSNANPPAVVGEAVIVREGYPDHTSWDPADAYYDPKSSEENPRWFMVDVKLKRIFDFPLPLETLRKVTALKQMQLLQKGSRLSVQPVTKKEYEAIIKLAGGTT